jgi:hypothetical protein
MENSANTASHSDLSPPSAAVFERPSIEEISLSCEISAYAADDDDRPLF